ncbi:MAG: hypothetical protein GDA53_03230 [Rhodobacteraceae bacterium]|nr:hypothetical protein [Paracoccaceae bacterium]
MSVMLEMPVAILPSLRFLTGNVAELQQMPVAPRDKYAGRNGRKISSASVI